MKKLHEQLMKSNAFVFDMDGTIVDLEDLNKKSFGDAINEKFDHELTDEEFSFLFAGRGAWGGFKAYLDEHSLGEEAKNELLEIYFEVKQTSLENEFEKVVTVKKGIHELLDVLREKGLKTALATSTGFELTDLILTKAKLKPKFNEIVTRSDVNKGKPDPEIFFLTMKKLGAEINKTIVFEDSINGITSAKSAGLYTVAIEHKRNKEYIKKEDAVIQDYREITKILSIGNGS